MLDCAADIERLAMVVIMSRAGRDWREAGTGAIAIKPRLRSGRRLLGLDSALVSIESYVLRLYVKCDGDEDAALVHGATVAELR